MNNATAPNIFDYGNFRDYLRDYYAFRNGRDRTFTTACICRRLGLPNTRSYFNDVLKGKFVSESKLSLLIELLELSEDEARFFRALVNYNQAGDPAEKELLLNQLIALNKTPKEIVSPQAYVYYRQWYHSAIRALLNICDFDGDYKKLAKALFPPVTPRQARESIQLLVELGLIARNEQGFYKPTAKVISTGTVMKQEIISQYQSSMLEMDRSIITHNHNQPQRIMTKVLSFSEDAYKQIEQRMEAFNAEITSIVHKDEKAADRVYHMNIMLIPLSKKGRT